MRTIEQRQVHAGGDGASAEILDAIQIGFDRAFDLLVDVSADQRMAKARLQQQNGAVNAVGAQHDKIGPYRVIFSLVDESNALGGIALNVDVFDLRVDTYIEIGMLDDVLHGVEG